MTSQRSRKGTENGHKGSKKAPAWHQKVSSGIKKTTKMLARGAKKKHWDQKGYQNGTQEASKTPFGRQSPKMTQKHQKGGDLRDSIF